MAASQIVSALANSIAKIGQIQPVITDAAGTVIDGNLRLQACAQAGVEPWIVVISTATLALRPHTYIRSGMPVIEVAALAADIREQEKGGDGARRAPGAGRVQKVVADRMESEFGMSISPRNAAHALSLHRANDDERAAVAAAEPESMRSALRILEENRAGVNGMVGGQHASRTDLVKCAYEFKAALLQFDQFVDLPDVDRAVLMELRDRLNGILAEGGIHAAS